MLNEKERQNILKTFFNRNPGGSENESAIIRCSEGDFGIMFQEDKGEFLIYKNADRGAVGDFELITDDQKDDAITALGKKLIFQAAAEFKEGDFKYLEACLDAGASVNERHVDLAGKPTVLHCAASYGKVEACKFLVRKGADIFAIDEGTKLTALGIASKIQREDVVEFLTIKRKEFCQHYYDQFDISKKLSNADSLYNSNSDPTTGQIEPFIDCDGFNYNIEYEQASNEYKIFGLGYDGSQFEIDPWEAGYALHNLGKQKIYDAIEKEDFNLVRACLDVGVSANGKTENEIPFIIRAAQLGNADICELLIDYGANVSEALENGEDALMSAASGGYVGVCELLIDEGADIFKVDSSGKTASYYGNMFPNLNQIFDAAEAAKGEERLAANRLEAERIIAEKDQILSEFFEELDDYSNTPSRGTFTHQNGREYSVLDNGRTFDLRDESALDNPLEDWETYYVLSTFGRNVDLDAEDSKFFAAAKQGGKLEFIRACLSSGIPVDEKDAEGKTALFYAREIDDQDTIDFLLDESAKKQSEQRFDSAKKNGTLKTFFDRVKTIDGDAKTIDGAEGEYRIEKEGKIFVFLGDDDEEEEIDDKSVEFKLAIGDIGRRLIFEAAKSGDIELFKACLDAGVSKDSVDEKGNRPLTYAKINPKSREIAALISGREKDPETQKRKEPRDNFRELAILVRDEYLAIEKEDKEEEEKEKIIQGVIASFEASNPQFNTYGLKASDMLAFMRDISIKRTEFPGVAGKLISNLDHVPAIFPGSTASKVLNLFEGKNSDGTSSVYKERAKAFYPELLVTCLGHEHHFVSDDQDHRIRTLIVKEALKINREEGETDGYLALNSVEKGSVADLYMRANFEKLKKREGLRDDLTYEEFSRKLGDVVRINSEGDKNRFLRTIADAESKLKELKLELNAIENGILAGDSNRLFALENARAEVASKEKSLKDYTDYRDGNEPYQERSLNHSCDQKYRALSALFGSDDKKSIDLDNRMGIAHGDLSLTLDMIRRGSEFSSDEIVFNSNLKYQKAASTIGKAFRDFKNRRDGFDGRGESPGSASSLLDRRIEDLLSLDLKKSTYSFDFNSDDEEEDDSERKISEEDFKRLYKDGSIEEVRGHEISNGNTGLVIHKFSGSKGLRDFTDQVANANRGEKKGTDQVSIAHIKDMPIGEGGRTKDSFCVVVSSDEGTTKIFSKKIDEVSERSAAIYQANLEFETKYRGIEEAIAFLTEAQSAISKFRDKVIRQSPNTALSEAVEDRFSRASRITSEELSGLRECLKGVDKEKDDLSEEFKKMNDRFQAFMTTPKGDSFEKWLDMGEIDNEFTTIPKEDIARVRARIKSLIIDGDSTIEMRDRARQKTSKQIQTEIAARVKSSKEANNFILKLDGLEVASVMAKYGSIDAKGREGLEKLLKEEMPASAYEGISVLRPRGKENIATVTFNGAYRGDDTMYLTLPDSPECYVRVFRCDRDGEFSFWENGKKVTETRSKGDIIIYTGVVFHKGSNGKYEPMSLKDAEDRFGREVKEAALDFKIKAISVDEGQRLKLATLYKGKAIEDSLVPKTSPLQKVDSHKPEKSLENQGVVFDGFLDDDGKFTSIAKAESRHINFGGCTLMIDENVRFKEDGQADITMPDVSGSVEPFRQKLQAELENMSTQKRDDFMKEDFFKDFSCEEKKQASQYIETRTYDELANLMVDVIPLVRKRSLESASKKYAAIHSTESLALFVPVVLESYSRDIDVKFSFPLIRFKDEKEFISKEIFDESGKIIEVNRAAIIGKVDRNFLRKFYSEDEVGNDQTPVKFLAQQGRYEDFCERMKEKCEKAKVTVSYQEFKKDGFKGEEKQYKKSGEVETKVFQLSEKTKATEEVSLLLKKAELEKSERKWVKNFFKKGISSTGSARGG
jgi:ankyrin repeat protein